MAGMESLSFCGPMLPFQPPPPMAQAPIPRASDVEVAGSELACFHRDIPWLAAWMHTSMRH